MVSIEMCFLNMVEHALVFPLTIVTPSFFNESWTKFHNVVRPPGLVHHGVRHLRREDHVQGHVVIVILIDLPLLAQNWDNCYTKVVKFKIFRKLKAVNN